MNNKELIEKTINNLEDTLLYFSSQKEQSRYKNSVPFVNIPEELIAQWDSFARLLYYQEWFVSELDKECIQKLKEFNIHIENFFEYCQDDCEDVPEIFENYEWINLSYHAKELLNYIKRSNCQK